MLAQPATKSLQPADLLDLGTRAKRQSLLRGSIIARAGARGRRRERSGLNFSVDTPAFGAAGQGLNGVAQRVGQMSIPQRPIYRSFNIRGPSKEGGLQVLPRRAGAKLVGQTLARQAIMGIGAACIRLQVHPAVRLAPDYWARVLLGKVKSQSKGSV